jgi:hypothetical protein
MPVECKRCGRPVADEKKECQACGEDNGYPNVRLALRPDEVQALARRLHDAEVSTTARKCGEILEKFGIAVLGSKAVISRSLSEHSSRLLYFRIFIRTYCLRCFRLTIKD